VGVVAFCVAAAGCSRVEQAAMPVDAKVNAAYPVSPEAKLAQERLLALLAGDAKAIDNMKAQSESLMTLRALSCSKNMRIGRFDSVAAVKQLPMDTTCFQQHDTELLRFYGIRIIGALLSKPPLRALEPAGPITALPKGKLSHISTGAMARDAAVGVLFDGTGAGVVVKMPGATPIAQLPQVGSVSQPGTYVSPNGRVVVLNPSGQGPVFIEAETGHRIWNLESRGGPRLLSWLPEVDGFIISGVDGNAMLADGLTGSFEPHPLSIRNSAYAAHIPGAPARLLMGTAREFVLVEHTRSEHGIRASTVKQYTITNGPGVTSGHPVPMRSGQMVVYASMRDIGWLDLNSGASGTWRSSPRFGIPFAKLDESRIMFDSSDPGGMSLTPWSFDITNETVAPIDLGGSRGLIVDIGDRVGFLRRGNEAWFGDKVTTGEAQPLDKAVAEFELKRQLARLQMLSDQGNAAGTEFARPPAINTSGGVVPSPPMPGLANVPADAEVHMVGVYEGKRMPGPSSGHPTRDVRVVARATGRPVVLALASYEPVNWIVASNGARISAVLLSGYHPSTVSGVGNVPVLRIGSAYAYSAGSPEYSRLRQAVAQYTGAREIRSFQGSYSGAEFSVGGR
jgi:hypothetical protein